MGITMKDLEAMARLSHISLSDEEKRTFPDRINEVLNYIDKLEELNTDGIKPTAFIHMLKAIRPADNERKRDGQKSGTSQAYHT